VYPASNLCNPSVQAYRDWKKRFSEVYHEFIPEELPRSVQPVKIAILDTGIDINHSLISFREERIKNMGNWLSEPHERDQKDPHGHGTHIAGVILDFVEDSEVFVARVTDGDTIDPKILAKVSLTVGQVEMRPFQTDFHRRSIMP
jgi:subtilisin family serine protease